MTTQEFSNEFDTLIQSYRIPDAFGMLNPLAFDEYEKSVFLTKALEDIVKDYYSGKNTYGFSFELTEELRKSLESLVNQKDYVTLSEDELKVANEDGSAKTQPYTLADILPFKKYKHYTYPIPTECWYIVYEQVKWGDTSVCFNGNIADVVPVTHDAFKRTIENPFRNPNLRKVLRLTNGTNKVELVTSNTIGTYTIRYIKKPEPIILETLPDGLTIDNKNTAQTCQLSNSIHRQILEQAVALAIASLKTNTK